jgi:hypothetical protein
MENQENVNIVNKMRQYEDPLLKAFEEEQKKPAQEEDSGSSEDDSSDELSDIKFPKENAAELLQFIMRDLNNIQNKEDKQKRKFSLLKLYEIFVLAREKAHNRIYHELLPELQKKLFRALLDPVEKCRELAALIIKEFFSRCEDLTLSIPYLLPIMVERLNAENLEGTDYMEDKIRPAVNQKA